MTGASLPRGRLRSQGNIIMRHLTCSHLNDHVIVRKRRWREGEGRRRRRRREGGGGGEGSK